MLTEPNSAVSDRVRAFLRDKIHNYEQLDVLLFLHARHQQSCSAPEVAAALHIADELVATALSELVNRGLVEIPESAAARYRLGFGDELRRLVDLVAQAHSEHYVLVVRLMSANAIERMRGAAGRAFADAFRIGREKHG